MTDARTAPTLTCPKCGKTAIRKRSAKTRSGDVVEWYLHHEGDRKSAYGFSVLVGAEFCTVIKMKGY